MSQAVFYQWCSKYGDTDVNIIKRLKELEAENSRLKKMYADERLMSQIRLETLEGKILAPYSRKKMASKLKNKH